MRWLRACCLLLLLAAATSAVTTAVLDPLTEGWGAVEAAAGPAINTPRTPGADLTALLTGTCALLVGVAWLWLVAAVIACTAEALRPGWSGGDGPGSTLLRPRMLRAVVATCLGVAALAAPAHAQPPVARVSALPDDVRAAAVTAARMSPWLLDGLPVPDRATGDLREPLPAPPPRLRVAPGDSLWSLTAAMFPDGTPDDTVATGWRLLYAANRGVVGADPDLLQPGQRLRVTAALEALARSVGHVGDAGAASHRPPLDPDAGGPR